jgi:hypothetical protein
MVRTFSALVLGAAVCATGLFSADAQETKKPDKPEIKGGIEAKVKKVDAEQGTLTVTIKEGRDRTFTVTDDTTIVGPRGGVVRRRLKDPRFHPGMEITVVASGNAAKELHLGYDYKDADDTAPKAKAPADAGARPAGEKGKVTTADKTQKTDTKTPDKAAAPGGAGKGSEAEDEEDEFPGKVKSADPDRRILVVTLLNGKDRAFLLAKDVRVTVKGVASKQGLGDPALKAGTAVTVITEPGGRKVKEVKVAPAPAAKARKAG